MKRFPKISNFAYFPSYRTNFTITKLEKLEEIENIKLIWNIIIIPKEISFKYQWFINYELLIPDENWVIDLSIKNNSYGKDLNNITISYLDAF